MMVRDTKRIFRTFLVEMMLPMIYLCLRFQGVDREQPTNEIIPRQQNAFSMDR